MKSNCLLQHLTAQAALLAGDSTKTLNLQPGFCGHVNMYTIWPSSLYVCRRSRHLLTFIRLDCLETSSLFSCNSR